MDTKELEYFIKQKLQMILGIKVEELGSEESLVDLGLDSYGFVELISEIENYFNIRFTEDDFMEDNFHSIKTIVALMAIRKK
jgi:acyl carrier protein